MSNISDHYFSASPASAADRRPLAVTLAGRDVEVEVAGGIFSPGRIDLGTAVLLRSVPTPPAVGNVLDLGCGWGPIALTLAMRSPDARVWAVDVNERALDLVRRNAEHLGLTNVTAAAPDDVPGDIEFDALWSNPPIRVGKEILHGMLHAWLPRLSPGALAHLVVQKNLGADSLQAWIAKEIAAAGTVTRLETSKGFRVLEVTAREV